VHLLLFGVQADSLGCHPGVQSYVYAVVLCVFACFTHGRPQTVYASCTIEVPTGLAATTRNTLVHYSRSRNAGDGSGLL
jgi:hypothetical protein